MRFMKLTSKKILIGTIFIMILLLSGCTENVTNHIPEELKDLTLIDEVEKIPEKEAVGAMDLLEFKLAKEDND